ncbi:hypothetical protein [Pseudoduganella umbonata]|uniref:PEP-CTERM sorting domain-containing protein n=2 Tax=Pseudoduganella umbonata TaxID=864828 RepID=A0ABX5UJU7_9BURK|nr:hypothetical protein [Pseudoduganella umbonata]QCP12039.1 hypothetical protein FCL38_17675 [Pseudoduganella umbonata]
MDVQFPREPIMKQLLRLIGTTMLSIAMAPGAQAIPLSTLLAGGTLNAGGLAFSDFGASYGASDPLRVFNAANIDVTVTSDGAPLGAGLRFDMRGNELAVHGNGVYAFVGLQMSFRVAMLDPALAGLGAALAMESRTIDMRHDDSGVYIADSVRGRPGGNGPVGFPGMGWDWNFPIPSFRTTDLASLAPQPGIWVDKHMLVWAVDRADTVALMVSSQRFSVELPEPGSLPLLAIAALAAAAVLRSKRPAV